MSSKDKKFWINCIIYSSFLGMILAQSLRIGLILAEFRLNDVDNDNIPGRAGVDYPTYSFPPEGTSFRCKDYDYAGYFADIESQCQAYHVCFPDGRNASFLCVNGTVFHQRYFVCDWWFHFNCSHAPSIYELNLFRKIPLPVLPPIRGRPLIKPIPEPKIALTPVMKKINPEKPTSEKKKDKHEKRKISMKQEMRAPRQKSNISYNKNEECTCTCDENQNSNKYLAIDLK